MNEIKEEVVFRGLSAGGYIVIPDREEFRKIWGCYPEEMILRGEEGEVIGNQSAPTNNSAPQKIVPSRKY